MNLFLTAVRLDVLLQSRSKLYLIGVLVALLTGLLGRFFVPRDYAGPVLAVFYLTGLGATTFMFSASLVLLEKSDGTLQALRTTPLLATTYIASKTLTLTCFSLIESAIVYAVAFLGVPIDPLPLAVGVILLGLFLTLVGLGLVAPYDSVTAFLFPGAVIVMAVLELPVLWIMVAPNSIWYAIPTQASLLWMLGASQPLETAQWVYAGIVGVVSVIAAFYWAKTRFSQHIGLQER